MHRPEKRNALTYALCRDLQALMPQLADDPQTRVVVRRGAGTRAFSSGMDVHDVLHGVSRDGAAPRDGAGAGQRRRP